VVRLLKGWTADGLWYEVWETSSGVVVRFRDDENGVVELYKVLESVFIPVLVKDLEEEGSWIVRGSVLKERAGYPAKAVKKKFKPPRIKAKLVMRRRVEKRFYVP